MKRLAALWARMNAFALHWRQRICPRFIVRHYDGFDRNWIDASGPLSRNAAQRRWLELTNDGTQNTGYDDIDYYRIFPANTRMLYAEGWKERTEKDSE